eukprot:594200-Rhodomonas_salina.1
MKARSEDNGLMSMLTSLPMIKLCHCCPSLYATATLTLRETGECGSSHRKNLKPCGDQVLGPVGCCVHMCALRLGETYPHYCKVSAIALNKGQRQTRQGSEGGKRWSLRIADCRSAGGDMGADNPEGLTASRSTGTSGRERKRMK